MHKFNRHGDKKFADLKIMEGLLLTEQNMKALEKTANDEKNNSFVLLQKLANSASFSFIFGLFKQAIQF